MILKSVLDIVEEFELADDFDEFNIYLHSRLPIIYIDEINTLSLETLFSLNVFVENNFYYKKKPSIEKFMEKYRRIRIPILTIEEQKQKLRKQKIKKIL